MCSYDKCVCLWMRFRSLCKYKMFMFSIWNNATSASEASIHALSKVFEWKNNGDEKQEWCDCDCYFCLRLWWFKLGFKHALSECTQTVLYVPAYRCF
jgi:hypothetical protein